MIKITGIRWDERQLWQPICGPTFWCLARNNFPVTYLFELCDRLPRGCRGDDGPVAPRAELQGQRESRHQLHSELCHTHFVIHHPDAPLSQDRGRQRREHLQQVQPQSHCRWEAAQTHTGAHTSWLTCTVVVPTARPCSTTPSCNRATSGSATFRE